MTTDTLPSIKLLYFTEQVFEKIIKTYANAARIANNPKIEAFDIKKETAITLALLTYDCSGREIPFGSSFTMGSCLSIQPIDKEGFQHVEFDFVTKAKDPHSERVRKTFHKEVKEYLDTLPI